MNNIFFGLIVLAILALTGFIIYAVVALKRTLDSVKQFIESTESVLVPAVDEVRQTLQSLRKVTDDAGVVTEDIKVLSASVRDVGNSVKSVSTIVNTALKGPTSQAAGLKAGFKAGFGYLIKNMLSKGDQCQ